MIFVYILLFFLLAGLIGTVVVIFLVATKVKGVADRFKQQSNWRPRYQQDASSGSGEPTIVDRRNPEEACQKIIPKDEGEYIDYTEER